jgi:hypothetical protein
MIRLMASAVCPKLGCLQALGEGRVQLISVGHLPSGPAIYVVSCRACGTALGVVTDPN